MMSEVADQQSVGRLGRYRVSLEQGLTVLSGREISMIDEALKCAGPDGEVVLTIQKGRLRFIAVTEDLSPED